MRKIILPLVAALAFAAPATAQLSCIGDPPLRSEK